MVSDQDIDFFLIKQNLKKIDLIEALNNWSGFVELRPAEAAQAKKRIFEIRPETTGDWDYDFHWRPSPLSLESVGCYFLQDVEVFSPGFSRKDNLVIHDESYTSFDTLKAQPDWSIAPKKNLRQIVRPTLIADGFNLKTWGHWIVEYLPRFAIAKFMLGHLFYSLNVILSNETPQWALDLIKKTCSLHDENFIFYNAWDDKVILKNAIIPTYAHTEEFFFHSFFSEFYRSVTPQKQLREMKICVSRSGSEALSKVRYFPMRNTFEQLASNFGYRIVYPELLSIEEQIELFSKAKCIVGEHGSGMHNAVFSAPNTIIGCLGFWNPIQLNIGTRFDHKNVYVTRGCEWPSEENPNFILNIDPVDMISMFMLIEKLSENF